MSDGRLLDFPFDILAQFDSVGEANKAGFSDGNVWSVVEGDETNSFTYGPPHHWINVLHYVATAETHDHNTYYIEEE